MNNPDDFSVTAISIPESADPVAWNAVCYPCQDGRTFSDEADLNIWLSAHEERHAARDEANPIHDDHDSGSLP